MKVYEVNFIPSWKYQVKTAILSMVHTIMLCWHSSMTALAIKGDYLLLFVVKKNFKKVWLS